MSTNPLVVPDAERYGALKDRIFGYVDIVSRIRAAKPEMAQQWPQLFLTLSYPWIVDTAQLSPDQKASVELRKQEIAQLPFDGNRVKHELADVLVKDKHLSECCPTLLHLANFLDSFFISAAVDAKRHGADETRLNLSYDEFRTMTYCQGRFRRIALSHLFNFDMEGNSATFEGTDPTQNIRVERLDASTIPTILGESGFQAFLHPVGIGDCFVVEDEGGSSTDDFQWLFSKWQKALNFAQALQYFQDGVIHVGYAAPFFSPNWANQIRRTGLFFIGEPRRIAYENGGQLYSVTAATMEKLALWWKAATSERIVKYITNRRGKLRQAIYRAGSYYESSHQRTLNVERLLALAIAVESLFSPSDKGELKFRIAQSAAQIIGQTPAERLQVFRSIARLYDRRSTLVHGSYDVDEYDEGRFVSSADIDEWSSYLRRSLRSFLTLYFKGDMQAGRDAIMQRIAAANFDGAEGDRLRGEADIDSYFAEVSATQRP